MIPLEIYDAKNLAMDYKIQLNEGVVALASEIFSMVQCLANGNKIIVEPTPFGQLSLMIYFDEGQKITSFVVENDTVFTVFSSNRGEQQHFPKKLTLH